MENNFKVEIVSPEKIIFSDNSIQVTVPSYEGEMSILKNHISIITFLRPGIIITNDDKGKIEKFFVEDGIAEFYANTLIILSSSILNIKELKMLLMKTNQLTVPSSVSIGPRTVPTSSSSSSRSSKKGASIP